MRKPAVVNHNRVGVPKIDGRQIARQDLLRLHVIRTAFGNVWTLGGVVEK